MAKPIYVYLIGHIRKVWRWSSKRRECLNAPGPCAICGKYASDYQADHKEPVGTAPKSPPWVGWDNYLHRMFEGTLQKACKKCHAEKTKRESAERAKQRRKQRAG